MNKVSRKRWLGYIVLFISIFFVVIILNEDKVLLGFNSKDILHLILQTTLIYSILAYLDKIRILKFVFILLIISTVASILTYKAFPSTGIIMSVLNTSFDEAGDFIRFNLVDILISSVLFVSLMISPVPLYKGVHKITLIFGVSYLIFPSILFAYGDKKIPNNYIQSGLARGMTTFGTEIEYIYSDEMAWRFPPLRTVKGVVDTINFISTNKSAEKSTWSNVKLGEASPNILIIGLGESLRSDHLGLYGYKRNTTPLLGHMKNDLFVYKSAYSGGTNTWTSVPSMFTKFKFKPDLSKSIVNLANDAGFETYWLSNQTKANKWDFSVSAIALQAKHIYFSANERTTDIKYDGVLIPKLLTVLKNSKKSDKLLIVLHFYGSHMNFKDRYPVEYGKFNGGKSKLEKEINEYDNTVLYTDYVLSRVLHIASKYKAKFIYFSDHGLGNTKGDMPLKYDVRKHPDVDSIHVPLISNTDLHLTRPVNLFYFECIFSKWAKINSSDLNDKYCNDVTGGNVITFYDAGLNLEHVRWRENSEISTK